MYDELLEKNNIPKEWWEYCFVKDDIIYTPQFDDNGNITITGEEYYNYIQNNKIDIIDYIRIMKMIMEEK